MSKLVPASAVSSTSLTPAEQHQHVLDKLTYWREQLIEHDHDLTNKTLTRSDITRQLNYWLACLWDHMVVTRMQADSSSIEDAMLALHREHVRATLQCPAGETP